MANNIEVLYEDNHLLVVSKPVNMLVQADSTGDPDLLSVLKEDIKKRFYKPGNVYLGLVHRLDRPVGGVMVFARTSKAASRLSSQIRERQLKKTYLAVIHGILKYQQGKLENYLIKDPETNISISSDSAEHGKKAELGYSVLETAEKSSLVEINLITGRSHQIRVQFAAAGNPLYGDVKYGAGLNKPGHQLALWSFRLGFLHPVRNEEMRFECRPPDLYPWNLFNMKT